MKSLLTLSFLFLSTFNLIFAQTKLIGHKSHSGSKASFKTALENDLFDMSASDFGETPEMIRAMSVTRLDSVIRISDSKVIVVTGILPESRRIADTIAISFKRDTFDHHPLFQHYHSLDSIKSVLNYQYYFRNDPQSVIFVGYDNIKPELIQEPIIKKELPKAKDVKTQPSKKQIRKAKKDLRKAKKKETQQEKKKQDENSFIPINFELPSDPPSNYFPLKLVVVFVLGMLFLLWLTYATFSKLRLKHN